MPDPYSNIPKPDFSQVKEGAAKPQPATPATSPAKLTSPSTPKPDFSNVQSGGSSTATVAKKKAADTERTYTVKAGDSLSKIAKREYGDAKLWNRIYEANKDTIKNPDLIYPGQVLKLPSGAPGGNA